MLILDFFPIPILIGLYSMFRSDYKVVYFSSIMHFKLLEFLFCSFNSVCYVLFGCVMFIF